MIIKSIFVFLILFIGYNSIHWMVPDLNHSLNQWHENRARAESFVYDERDLQAVIVGSSLAARINQDSLNGFFNLATSGQSIYDGLEVMKRSGKIPKVLFIEANFPMKNKNEDYLADVFSPELYQMRQIFPALRADRAPSAMPFALKDKLSKDKKPIPNVTSAENLKTMLNIQQKAFAELPDATKLKLKLKELKNYVAYFKSKGCRIIFFEVPIHPSLIEMPFAQAMRKAMKESFPETTFPFLSYPASEQVMTTSDGLHFNDQDLMTYLRFFKKALPDFKLPA